MCSNGYSVRHIYIYMTVIVAISFSIRIYLGAQNYLLYTNNFNSKFCNCFVLPHIYPPTLIYSPDQVAGCFLCCYYRVLATCTLSLKLECTLLMIYYFKLPFTFYSPFRPHPISIIVNH